MCGKRKTGPGILLVAALAASGCSDSTGPGGLSPQASMEIATTLMAEIISIGFMALGDPADEGTGVLAIPEAVRAEMIAAATTSITETMPCDLGGNIVVQGTYSDNFSDQGTGSVSFDLRQRPNNCVMQTSSGNYTVNGNPELNVGGTLTVSSWNLGIFTMNFGGGFRWNGPGGSGTCNMDLNYHFNYTTYVFSGSGHICGHPVDYSHP
jgi:hypothetical protein